MLKLHLNTIGPHCGGSWNYDAHITLRNMYQHSKYNVLPGRNLNTTQLMNSGEFWIGDGHYSSLPWVISPFKRTRPLTYHELMTNQIISHYRARVEHVNAKIKKHTLFQTPYRGTIETLDTLLKITMHTTSVWTKMYIAYPPFGPWDHFQL